jgi:hypothetical protein
MKTIDRLVHYLAFHVAQISDRGLYHGRMGIILSLYFYGKAHNDLCLCNYIRDILQDTSNDYYDGDISLENGLSGLGLGVSLLYKAGMFKDDLNDILYEIDKKIMTSDPRRMEDHSLQRGALGVLFYIKTRFSIGQICTSICEDYIHELESNVKESRSEYMTIELFMKSLKRPQWKMNEYLGKELGIDNGSAYYLIKDSYAKVLYR